VTNKIPFIKLDPDAGEPTKKHQHDAAWDIPALEDGKIEPGERGVVRTGLAMAIPNWCYGQVLPRSGLAFKHGIATGAGVIDATYRGEIKILLFNHGDKPFHWNAGDRICQLVVYALPPLTMEQVTSIDGTERGEKGFGSSGV